MINNQNQDEGSVTFSVAIPLSDEKYFRKSGYWSFIGVVKLTEGKQKFQQEQKSFMKMLNYGYNPVKSVVSWTLSKTEMFFNWARLTSIYGFSRCACVRAC